MTPDPFLRHHGHGAARLAIGSIEGGLSIRRLAARPVHHEALIARLPGLVCGLAALALGWSLSFSPSVAPERAPGLASGEAEPPLAIRIWQASRPTGARASPSPPIPGPPIPDPPPPSRASTSHRPGPTAVPTTANRPSRPKRAAPVPAPSSRSDPPDQAPFDPRSLALPPSRAATPPSLSDPFPLARPTDRDTSARPMASAGRAPVRLRRAFLASVMSSEGLAAPAEPGSSVEESAAARRPPVAARAHDPALAASIRSELARWREVPLDDLPDCTPRGRQDALKQQILRAAPFDRACSHPEGRYRFVQTRNLNAFLMWSRPNPETRLRREGDRDACDVLERALRCLGDPTHEELSIR